MNWSAIVAPLRSAKRENRERIEESIKGLATLETVVALSSSSHSPIVVPLSTFDCMY